VVVWTRCWNGSKQQYGRAITFLEAPGTFSEDILVHVSASELRAWVDELPGDDAHANIFAP